MTTASPSVCRPARYHRPLSVAVLLCLFYLPLAIAQQTLELKISGVEGVLLDNVRANLGLSQYARTTPGLPLPLPLPGMTGPQKLPAADEIRRLHRRAEKDIRAALQPYGYYEPVIESSLEQQGERWIASYRIVHGPPVLLQSVDIAISGAGAADPALDKVRNSTRLRAGERLQHPYYDATREALISAAVKAGYLDARYLKSQLRVNPAAHRADAILHLDTGLRFYFGPVTVEQDILNPGFVSRYVRIEEGEPFDTGKLLDLQLALGDSGYFDQVDLDVRRSETQDQRVPVIVHTLPAAHTRYTLGLGFGTDTGPRVTLGANYPRINRRGHGVKSELRLSAPAQNAAVHYMIPIRNLVSDRLVFGGELENAEVANSGSTRGYKLGVSQNVSLGAFQRRLYINYQHETFDLGTENDTVNFLIPGVGISKIKSDNVLFPRRGYSFNADLRGSPGLISATRFVRTEAGVRGVYPLGSKGRLIGRGQLGYTTVDDFDKLPASERFFAGGDQSVRGYDYQKLAPVDSSGEVIGGQYLAVGSIEMDYLFVGNFGAAVFVDAGNADDSFLPQPKVGAGIGFRWRSPVGMLRVDVAHPFDDPDNNFRLHISIGPDL
ncbi:MAG TPA: outer membrane protein assembly factor [Gammaproteobacteria bacterium]|nr:outer membrane protein assembly factor [Gammaproteobacteria bacterium]